MFQSKRKALTFSYDDGTTQDIRLIRLFDRWGMKATFNINSGLLGRPGSLLREGVTVSHDKVSADEVAQIYRGHEVAAHSLTHPTLWDLPEEEMLREVEEDRLALSRLVGYEVKGLAYPNYASHNDPERSALIGARTGAAWGRTTVSSHGFSAHQSDLMEFEPTVHHHTEWDEMERLADVFLAAEPEEDMLFFVWGHSFEFDIADTWDRFERFLSKLAGRDDIFYGTNSECLLSEKVNK